MRLIDADQLRYEAELCRETTDEFLKLIDQQPTAVVKCGDCVSRYYGVDCGGLCRRGIGNAFTDDGFCSMGELKDS